MNSQIITNRLHVVDAIRGFAIISIMLLHNLEHFDVYFLPPNLPDWMVWFDKIIWDSLFFLFAGKSYAIFALLFGLTFFIQKDNQEKRGGVFRIRFAWRLMILFGFGIINSIFYQGDILTIYAGIGFLLIPIANLSNRALFIIAIILLLQPLELYFLLNAIQHPDTEIHNPESWNFFGKMDEYIKGDSFLETVKGNLTNGKIAVLNWSYENGRFFQIPSLFIFGLLAGRKQLFVWSDANKKFWQKVLIISCVIFIPLFIFNEYQADLIGSEIISRSVSTIITSWANIAFMSILVSGFVQLFNINYFNKLLNGFSPIGSMSLSNYIIQSIIGSTIYYEYGFGLYKFTGATYSFIIAIILAILMWFFSSWWMKKYKRGPLEGIWHKATWLSN